MDCFVYVLGTRNKNRHLTYVGWTDDIARRLARHNAGKGARTTRGRKWVLLHSEWFATRREAMSREWRLKRDRKFRKQLAQRLKK
jgi:putative endonuclease